MWKDLLEEDGKSLNRQLPVASTLEDDYFCQVVFVQQTWMWKTWMAKTDPAHRASSEPFPSSAIVLTKNGFNLQTGLVNLRESSPP